MILDIFKKSGKESMAAKSIILQVQQKYESKTPQQQKHRLKISLKKLIADKTFVNSTGSGLNGSVKLNTAKSKPTPKPSKKVQAAKKKTATAKRTLKKAVPKP